MVQRRIWTASTMAAAIVAGGLISLNSSASATVGHVSSPPPVVVATAPATAQSQLGAGEKVIFDTDFGQLNDDSQGLFMLTQSKAQVLGVTTVIGNDYEEEGTAYALRQLERVGRKGIPVVEGAKQPLFGSRKDQLEALGELFGKSEYNGAWGSDQPSSYRAVKDVYRGQARTKPLANITASDFIARQVKKYPHQVTLMAIGPLTNVAIAAREHPEIVPLVKQIVYMGGAFDVPGNTTPAAEFNIWIDPEAARITFAQKWAKQVVVPLDLTNTVRFSNTEYQRVIAGKNTTIKQQFKETQGPGFTKDPKSSFYVYDTLAVGVFLKPGIINQSSVRYTTVDTQLGYNYGRTMGFTAPYQPKGLQQATVVQRVNNKQFFDMYVALLSAPVRH
jgi:inosine-uridine nucleoside N-ribohydrolase